MMTFHAISGGIYIHIALSDISRVNPKDESIAIYLPFNVYFNTSHRGRFLVDNNENWYTWYNLVQPQNLLFIYA